MASILRLCAYLFCGYLIVKFFQTAPKNTPSTRYTLKEPLLYRLKDERSLRGFRRSEVEIGEKSLFIEEDSPENYGEDFSEN
jgi:hypothetical protein